MERKDRRRSFPVLESQDVDSTQKLGLRKKGEVPGGNNHVRSESGR